MAENNANPLLPRVGLTHGDINGISYETILRAFGDSRMMSTMTPILYGQSKALSYYKKNFGLDEFNYSLTRDARQSWNQKFNIINIVDDELKIEPGKPTEVSAQMSLLSMKKAAEDLNNGYIDALVMTPTCRAIEKSNNDFLLSFHKDSEVMRVMVNDLLRVGLVTDDVPIAEAVRLIDSKRIGQRLRVFAKALKEDFEIASPKIAVLGLDPYSSDESPENDMVSAAVKAAREAGVFAFGPFPSSRLFGGNLWQKYDAVLALYQEQACLPLKLLSAGDSAFYWAGLPVLCAAPIQGPGFEIANMKQATPDALRAAIYLVSDILSHRSTK